MRLFPPAVNRYRSAISRHKQSVMVGSVRRGRLSDGRHPRVKITLLKIIFAAQTISQHLASIDGSRYDDIFDAWCKISTYWSPIATNVYVYVSKGPWINKRYLYIRSASQGSCKTTTFVICHVISCLCFKVWKSLQNGKFFSNFMMTKMFFYLKNVLFINNLLRHRTTIYKYRPNTDGEYFWISNCGCVMLTSISSQYSTVYIMRFGMSVTHVFWYLGDKGRVLYVGGPWSAWCLHGKGCLVFTLHETGITVQSWNRAIVE